jgi:hypothetical protein
VCMHRSVSYLYLSRFQPDDLRACTTLKTCIDLGSSHGYQTHKCSHQLEELPGHTLLVNVDQVEDGDEGLSPGERGKQQAERAQASDGQGPLLGRKRRAESAAGSEQDKVPRVANTQRVFLQSVSDMMGSFQVVDFAGGLLLLLCR